MGTFMEVEMEKSLTKWEQEWRDGMEADEESEFGFDRMIPKRELMGDLKGGITDPAISPAEKRIDILKSARATGVPAQFTDFDPAIDREGYDLVRWDEDKIPKEFEKAWNKEKNANQFIGSTIESAWNWIPDTALFVGIAPKLTVNQWRKAIREADPVGDILTRYEQNEAAFWGDVAGSLLGFSGGLALISKAGGKVGGKVTKPIVWAVQPDEEILTLLGA